MAIRTNFLGVQLGQSLVQKSAEILAAAAAERIAGRTSFIQLCQGNIPDRLQGCCLRHFEMGFVPRLQTLNVNFYFMLIVIHCKIPFCLLGAASAACGGPVVFTSYPLFP